MKQNIVKYTLSGLLLLLTPTWVQADPGSDWVGPYLGITAGLTGLGSTIENGAGGRDVNLDEGTGSIGIVGGYTFAPFGKGKSGQWLIGAEADFQSFTGDESKTDAVLGTVEMESNWLASTRVRAGYAWESVFIYGTTGIAFSDISVKSAGGKSDDINVGLALGLGAEMRFNEYWSGRLEGIAYGFGEDDRQIAGTKHDIGSGGATLRIGLTRRF